MADPHPSQIDPPTPERKLCRFCGKPIPPERPRRAIYCNNVCRHAMRLRQPTARPYIRPADDVWICQGTRGAIAELAVATDLLQRGYDVFRSVSQACSCDLVALKHGVLTRIEVKSGILRASRAIVPSVRGVFARRDRHDVLALYFHANHSIIYEPELTHRVVICAK